MVRDECLLDPYTKLRVGPSVISTVLFTLIALSAFTWMVATTRSVVSNDKERMERRVTVAASIGAYCLALVGYFMDRAPAWEAARCLLP